MPIGNVKSFNSDLGYGVITPDDDSKQVFFHTSDFIQARPGAPWIGQRVSYDIRQDPGKLTAINIFLMYGSYENDKANARLPVRQVINDQ
jgi:CspA family cold shock protein